MKNGGFMKSSIKLLVAIILAVMILTGMAASTDISYNSSLECKECHVQIYNEWNESMHATGLMDPVFLKALSLWEDKSICMFCHAPTTRLTNDFDLKDKITNEAVTCDFCHTISGLNESNIIQPFNLTPGNTKYGPHADSISPHKMQYLELLKRSDFCGACHEVRFPNGLEVTATYTEWKNSDYAKKGVQCQDCHMMAVKRSIAKGSPERNDSHKHDWRGGHSADMIREGGKLELDAKAEGGKVFITAVITNDRAGHKFPSADVPQLILDVSATDKDGNKLFEEKKIFSKVYGDEKGNVTFAPAPPTTQILSDNRILPNDKSINKFSFDVDENKGDVTIEGTLVYRLVPEELAPIPGIKINEVRKTVNVGPSTPVPSNWFLGILVLVGMVAVVALSVLRRQSK